ADTLQRRGVEGEARLGGGALRQRQPQAADRFRPVEDHHGPRSHVPQPLRFLREDGDDPQRRYVVDDAEDVPDEDPAGVEREAVEPDHADPRHPLADRLAPQAQLAEAVVEEAPHARDEEEHADEVQRDLGRLAGLPDRATGRLPARAADTPADRLGDRPLADQDEEYRQARDAHYDVVDEPRHEPRPEPGGLIRHLDVFRRLEFDHGRPSMSSFITRNKPDWDELEALV